MSLDLWDRVKKAEHPPQRSADFTSSQRLPQAPLRTSTPCPTLVSMGTHLGSHQVLLSLFLSLGPHLVWSHVALFSLGVCPFSL